MIEDEALIGVYVSLPDEKTDWLTDELRPHRWCVSCEMYFEESVNAHIAWHLVQELK